MTAKLEGSLGRIARPLRWKEWGEGDRPAQGWLAWLASRGSRGLHRVACLCITQRRVACIPMITGSISTQLQACL